MSNREGGDIAFTVIKDCRHIWRENALVVVPALHRRVGPPQEVARRGVGVKYFAGNFDQRTIRIKRKTGHYLKATHRFGFAHPDGLCAVVGRLNAHIHGHKRGRTMVLRPVKFYTAGDPRPEQADQRGFDHLVVVDKIALFDFVIGAVNSSAQFRQQHNADKVVFHPHRLVLAHFAFARQGVGDAIGIDRAGRALIDAFFEKHRIGIFAACRPGGERESFLPDFNNSVHSHSPVNKC
ncbi:hypothetical protein D3C71_1216060 [compost metagenome]